jgi:predicted nuclease of predicted toxin-antitoxin system
MKLLLDANLSWRLTERLKLHFTDCVHVDKVGLPLPATDTQIWDYAFSHNLIIVTNDDDFLNYVSVKGFPPKIVLLRTGNQSNEYLLSLLVRHKDAIAALHQSEEIGLLELF